MTTSTPEIWINRAAKEARAALTAPSPLAARIHRGLAAAYRVHAICGVPDIDHSLVAKTPTR